MEISETVLDASQTQNNRMEVMCPQFRNACKVKMGKKKSLWLFVKTRKYFQYRIEYAYFII